jgi:hypothetical protein
MAEPAVYDRQSVMARVALTIGRKRLNRKRKSSATAMVKVCV